MNDPQALTLCLDVGNTNLYAGVYQNDAVLFSFRKTSADGASSDEYGVFLKSVIRENGYDPAAISAIGICSVVPDAVYSVRRSCQKYFGCEPFILRAGVKTGLHITYRNPQDVGADRIANAVAAVKRYPDQACIVVDFGTATTFDAVTADRKYLGGAIMPGLRISMEALEARTAKLPTVEIIRAEQALGRSTVESIQSGLYFGTVGMIKELTGRIAQESFGEARPKVIATGGFSHLFSEAGLFDAILPDLVLEGLYQTMLLNPHQPEMEGN